MADIQQFYRDQSVLVTGATGFLGKALVEKLLRSCSEVNTIYILIRNKAGWSTQSRLTQLLDNPLFDKLKEEKPETLEKICPIEGDIGLPNLGLKLIDKNVLISKVNVVIHSAATVRFDEPLDQSLNLNLLGVKRVVDLCKQMSNLKALVHISTAYTNCNQNGLIEERVYPPPPGGMEILSLLDDLGKISDNIKYYEGEIQKCRPNTYTYTKAIAENYVMSEAKSIPLCIVRPSIVTASVAEPVPGWVDNMNGATGLIAGMGIGVLRLLLLDRSIHLNMIPVDAVVNMILCAGKETSLQNNGLQYPKVYNCCCPKEIQITLGQQIPRMLLMFRSSKPFSGLIWNPSPTFTTNRLWYSVNDFLFQYLPALSIECLSIKCFGLLASYRKLTRATKSLEFFTLNEWQFATHNMKQLHKTLSEGDKNRFKFHMDHFNWPKYTWDYCEGVKKFIFKVNDKSDQRFISHLPPLYLIHTLVVCFFLLMLGVGLCLTL